MSLAHVHIVDGHCDNILQTLWKQCNGSEDLCDVVLIAGIEKRRIPAHRCILTAASVEFKRILMSATAAKGDVLVVELPKMDANALEILVEYCYIGRIIIRWDVIFQLAFTAKMLHLGDVVEACCQYLAKTLHPGNCLGFMDLAKRCECQTFLQQARSYALAHFVEVCELDEFLELDVAELSQLLASDELVVASERDIFNSVMLWIQRDLNVRERHLAELLQLVRLPLLEQTFLEERVQPVCSKSAECLQIYKEAIKWNLSQTSERPLRSKSIKPRKSSPFLLALTRNESERKLCLHYNCPQRQKWLKWSQCLEYRTFFDVAVMDDNMLIVGGKNAEGNILNTIICLNLKTMHVRALPPMAMGRLNCCVAVLNGSLYALSDDTGNEELNAVEKWSPSTNAWSKVASMRGSRYNFGIAVLNKKLYVVGGFANGSALYSAECYSPQENAWNAISSMHERRESPGVAVAKNQLYAMGGWNDIKTVERYDPEANSWTVICSLRESLSFSRLCTAFFDKAIVCYNDRIEEYDDETDEWKTSAALKGLRNICHVMAYANLLATSELIEH